MKLMVMVRECLYMTGLLSKLQVQCEVRGPTSALILPVECSAMHTLADCEEWSDSALVPNSDEQRPG